MICISDNMIWLSENKPLSWACVKFPASDAMGLRTCYYTLSVGFSPSITKYTRLDNMFRFYSRKKAGVSRITLALAPWVLSIPLIIACPLRNILQLYSLLIVLLKNYCLIFFVEFHGGFTSTLKMYRLQYVSLITLSCRIKKADLSLKSIMIAYLRVIFISPSSLRVKFLHSSIRF